MPVSENGRFRTAAVLFLTAVITAGLVIVFSRLAPGQPVTISVPESEPRAGEIYIGGEVNNPGYYPYRTDDTLESLVRAAGGAVAGADTGDIELRIQPEAEGGAQQVNINRAEAWLLDALPGIGETLAERIVEYREANGLFKNISELRNIEGIGDSIFENISGLITVAD